MTMAIVHSLKPLNYYIYIYIVEGLLACFELFKCWPQLWVKVHFWFRSVFYLALFMLKFLFDSFNRSVHFVYQWRCFAFVQPISLIVVVYWWLLVSRWALSNILRPITCQHHIRGFFTVFFMHFCLFSAHWKIHQICSRTMEHFFRIHCILHEVLYFLFLACIFLFWYRRYCSKSTAVPI